MFSLVQFTDDLIYHVCKSRQIRRRKKNIFEAKWTNGNYYPAKIIASNDNLTLLNGFKINFEFEYPRVVLPVNRGTNCNSTAGVNAGRTYNVSCLPSSDLSNKKRRSPLNFELIEPASKYVHLENVNMTISPSAGILREERSSSVNLQIIDSVCELPIDFENGEGCLDLTHKAEEVHFEYPLDNVHSNAEPYSTCRGTCIQTVTEHDYVTTNIDQSFDYTNEENMSSSVEDGEAQSCATILNNVEFELVDTMAEDPTEQSFDYTNEENMSSLVEDGEAQSCATILNNVEFELVDTMTEDPADQSFDCINEQNVGSSVGKGEVQSGITVLDNLELVPEDLLNVNIVDITGSDNNHLTVGASANTIENTLSYIEQKEHTVKQNRRPRIPNENC
uniref:Uncharacterized protein n=1 Tax=Photinus pyralis TaxID=7054 RepID=A0A1Y1LRT5_PHOPY